MAKIRVTQIKSKCSCSVRHKRTLQALGLKKTNSSVEVEGTPQILGMVDKMKHMLLIENI